MNKKIALPLIAVLFVLAGALFPAVRNRTDGGAADTDSAAIPASGAGSINGANDIYGMENANSADTEARRGREIILSVFADPALRRPLEEIAEKYPDAAPGVRIAYTFEPSGELRRRIQEGAYCDLFLSAAPEPMDALENTADGGPPWNPATRNLLLPDSRIDLLETLLVLVPPDGNPAGIRDFRQLAQMLKQGGILIAVGESDGAAGLYTDRILNYWRLDREEIASCLAVGIGGGEEAARVADGSVDCGILFATDAQAWKLTAVDEAPEEATGSVVFPGAVLADSRNPDAALAFLLYLREEPAAAYFRKAGFTHLASLPAQWPNAALLRNWETEAGETGNTEGMDFPEDMESAESTENMEWDMPEA